MMNIRIVGAYGGESPVHRMTCFVLNGTTALDAGSLTRGLNLEDQLRIRDILLSHSHMDHITSLPFLVENVFGRSAEALTIRCLKESMANIRKNMFNNDTWPDFTSIPERSVPSIRFEEIHPEVAFDVDGVYYLPVAVDHIVPTVGFLIHGVTASVLYSSDTAPTHRIWEIANATPSLQAVFLEVSFGNGMTEVARLSKHLVPAMVAEELKKLKRDVPVYLYHMKPPHVAVIQREVRALNNPQLQFLEQDRDYRFE
jgi:ribonuclease BN (tRNA processing enzyme)